MQPRLFAQDRYGGVPGGVHTLRVDTTTILSYVTYITSKMHVNNVT